ncbi:hypothetical protein R50345_29790 [Paenibacillus sp. FSL R5-0345]|uniref:hypothetical protein n=1 Tax=Paenibacillus sp. FSL R5-0345 TaxID=1536770 RepID=UPI0004F5B9F0|nr:hypothetical protein [Paenibacillus sp. FSL R5-0345]AIQ38439.1 hypothetical protein R50345_29790 [Paenibacillus sp. FSL R5-0345]
MIVLSCLLLITGISLPIVLFIYKRKHEIINLLFILSPLISLMLVNMGAANNSYLMYDNEKLGMLLFIICISEISLTALYLVYYACLKGIKFIGSENEWSKLGPKHELFSQILTIIFLLLLPNVIFALLYVFWGLLFINNFNLLVGESIYYAFSIIYSLPMSGELAEFQEYVSLNDLLRVVQMIHVLIAKMIEFIVIGFIIGKVVTLIQDKLVIRS